MTLNEEQVSILKIIFHAKPELRKSLLKNADKQLVTTLCECVLNILLGNVPINNSPKEKLVKHKTFLRHIVKTG